MPKFIHHASFSDIVTSLSHELHPLHKILHPKSIAFYGANNDFLQTMGTIQMLNLIDQGYPREQIYPIHPRIETVLGLKAYKNIADVPIVPDLAFLVLPTRVVPQVMEELGQKGVDRVIMVTAGFREVGDSAGEANVKRIAEKYHIRFVGPNCIGVFNSHLDPNHPEQILNTTWTHYPTKPGNISIATQSGTFACHVFLPAVEMGLYLNKTISVGNEANIDICDCLEYFRDDPTTQVICLYIEEVKRGARFLELVKEITPKKPIIAIYLGGTSGGAKAVSSHTGSMAGNDAIFDAVFEQAGIRRVSCMREFLLTAMLFGHYVHRGVLPKGRRLGIITDSGGAGAEMADLGSRLGLTVPEFSADLQEKLKKHLPATAGFRNPIDFTYVINPAIFFDSVPYPIFKSGEIDAIVCYGAYGDGYFQYGPFGSELMNRADAKALMVQFMQIFATVMERVQKYPKKFNVPIAHINLLDVKDDIVTALRETYDLPVFKFPDEAVRSMAHLIEYGVFRHKIEQNENK